MKWVLVSVVLVCLSAPTFGRSWIRDDDQKYNKADSSSITDSNGSDQVTMRGIEVNSRNESGIVEETTISGDEDDSKDRSTSPPPKKKVSSKLLEVVERLKTLNCVRACGLNASKEFNPVCGSGAITFDNMGIFECTRDCGVGIEVSHNGPCP